MDTNRGENEDIAVVTGGASGIGKSISRKLIQRGFTVVIADPADEVHDTADELSRTGTALAVPTDVSSVAAVEDLFTVVSEEFGQLDVLVNNAGIFQSADPTVSQSVEEWQRVIDVHLRGSYLCSKFAAPLLLERNGAAVVNISSVAGFGAFPFRTAYGPAKSAINNLTQVLAVEWAQESVRVNAVAPGYVQTDRPEEQNEELDFDPESIRNRTPMGKLGDPGDIAEAVCFLVSDQAEYITGVVLPVDGGWSAYGYT